jgi:hypothetical protein
MKRIILSAGDIETLSRILPEVTVQTEALPSLLTGESQISRTAHLTPHQWLKWEREMELQKLQAAYCLNQFYATQRRMHFRVS